MGRNYFVKMKIINAILATWAVETNAAATCADGIHPVECACDKFYMCSHGNPHPEQSCAPGTLFNPELSVCDWPDNVECAPCPTEAPTEAPTRPKPKHQLSQQMHPPLRR